jgi:hypothetical protein
MPYRPSNARRSALDRFMRLRVVRCVLAAVLIPVLVLGIFGGITFLSHSHDEHDSHLHASSSFGDTRLSAEQHRLAHAVGMDPHQGCRSCSEGCPLSSSDPIEEQDFPAPTEAPDGLVITIPDHEQLVARGIDLSQTLKAAQVFQCFLASYWAQPDVSEEAGSPGGLDPSGPRHLCALTAGQRLVRTSQALLI